jgi:hypothetical protein
MRRPLKEFCERERVSQRYAYNEHYAGRLVFEKVGSRIFVDDEDAARWRALAPKVGRIGDVALQAAERDSRKWEWWTDGRKRSRTICVRLWSDSTELTIAHRGVGSDGCMSELNAFLCDVEHLPKLLFALNRALAVAHEHGLIKQSKK